MANVGLELAAKQVLDVGLGKSSLACKQTHFPSKSSLNIFLALGT